MTIPKIGTIYIELALSEAQTTPPVKQTVLGKVRTTPSGFLNLLETRLGVNAPNVSFTTRLVQYLYCLERTPKTDVFYAASYEKDPFAVARRLLQWRDDLYLAGWTGQFLKTDNLSPRLKDMASIERLAINEVAAGMGQKCQYVLSRLRDDKVHIAQIRLLDTLQYFPPLIQKIIQAINCEIIEPEALTTNAPPGSDLEKIQCLFLSGSSLQPFNHDGSLLLIEADDAYAMTRLTADIMGQAFKQDPASNLTIICEQNGHMLDENLEQKGLARGGFSDSSAWRPIFQVLPLAIELLWHPLNPRRILQFLTNPVCPLQGRVRYPLAEIIADTPGIGGPKWQEAIEKIVSQEADAVKAKAAEKDIAFWLECERFKPETGIPTDVIIERIHAVSGWVTKTMRMNDDPSVHQLHAIAKGQAEDLLLAVRRLEKYNNGFLTQDHLRRLVDDIKGVGSPVVDREAELAQGLAPVQCRNDSGAVFERSETIIWAGASGDIKFQPTIWSDAEILALTENDIFFTPDALILEGLNLRRIRPVLMATKQLIILTHKSRAVDHPVWTRIKCAAEVLPVLSVDAALKRLTIDQRLVKNLSLPVKQREWQLPAETPLPNKDYSSYSSLDKFLFSPYQWVLNYAARIKSGSLLIANEGSLLKGNLAHRLIEKFLDAHPDIQAINIDLINDWVGDNIGPLIEQEGAILMEDGAFREKVAFISTMKNALTQLIVHLKSATIVKTETELWATSNFIGGSLQGSIDILAKTEAGTQAIIDIKYGSLKYRREEMEKSQYLQLLTYDRLSQSDPHLSFFIITDADMLNLSHDFFKGGERIDPDLGLSPDDYWKNIETIWQHRRQHLDQGLIEVTISGTEPTERSRPNGIALDIPESNDRYNDYTALTGWEPGA